MIDTTLQTLVRRLLAARNTQGHWEGRLASSALATATAAIALQLVGGRPRLVEAGLDWLARNRNADGGWGDTTISQSNISTTSLCVAAFRAAGGTPPPEAEAWLGRAAGGPGAEALRLAILRRYASDQTFSVPILTVLALAGLQDWHRVPQLPFELATLPRSWFRMLNLRVVSYALPALIAIGQIHHHKSPSRNPVARWLRDRAVAPTLDLLGRIQPSSGGYLEATPLTSFVCMGLAAAGRSHHAVAQSCARFLEVSIRSDGSWPIDTNLATWATTLSVNALAPLNVLTREDREAIADWLLRQQYREVHPFTDAAPGGWAWTDLPGGVPDADDTPGALLALHNLDVRREESLEAATKGVEWLLDLQNSDGGIPTFCRGWGKLPFDRSSPDLTAHTLLAWRAWLPQLPAALRSRVESADRRARRWLDRVQRADGAWVPLWFGNEREANQDNPVYGTGRVVAAHRSGRGVAYLNRAQNADGGWGGGVGLESSIEETAIAMGGLGGSECGAAWLAQATKAGEHTPPSPIGLYFARLWYYEELYPLIFSTGALAGSRPQS